MLFGRQIKSLCFDFVMSCFMLCFVRSCVHLLPCFMLYLCFLWLLLLRLMEHQKKGKRMFEDECHVQENGCNKLSLINEFLWTHFLNNFFISCLHDMNHYCHHVIVHAYIIEENKILNLGVRVSSNIKNWKIYEICFKCEENFQIKSYFLKSNKIILKWNKSFKKFNYFSNQVASIFLHRLIIGIIILNMRINKIIFLSHTKL